MTVKIIHGGRGGNGASDDEDQGYFTSSFSICDVQTGRLTPLEKLRMLRPMEDETVEDDNPTQMISRMPLPPEQLQALSAVLTVPLDRMPRHLGTQHGQKFFALSLTALKRHAGFTELNVGFDDAGNAQLYRHITSEDRNLTPFFLTAGELESLAMAYLMARSHHANSTPPTNPNKPHNPQGAA